MQKYRENTTGMVLGKFMPPHMGHKYLIDFARNYVENLTVLVGTLISEPIPGDLRHRWVKELFPDVNVLHLTDENPQYPEEHPDFWQIWHDSIRRLIPSGPDYVFASEDYGWKLAEILGAEFVPVDVGREIVPISGTAVRDNPYENWQYIPECVKPYFVKRVCIFGPESTGKSTLTKRLAEHFHTVYVSEYARIVIEANDGRCCIEDIEKIARGQIASEDALVRQANRLLFCDTDLLTTTIWSRELFGKCPKWVEESANERKYDLYLLLDVDVPWVDDIVRYLPEARKSFFDECEAVLKKCQANYVVIAGSWSERFEKSCLEVEKLIKIK